MYRNLHFILFLISLTAFSQDFSEEEIYSWYDQQEGIENATLFRGIEYVETDRMINEKHKFFITQEFQIANLTYNGDRFFNVPLRYNIYDDVLLVNLQNNKSNFIFQLISDKVSQFQFDNYKFRYLSNNDNKNITGFYEVIDEEGDFKIYKKYLQNRREIRDRSVAYIEFEARNSEYIFKFKNDISNLDNQRALYAEFPDLKNEIKNIYKKYAEEERKKPDAFMKNLAREMNFLIFKALKESQE